MHLMQYQSGGCERRNEGREGGKEMDGMEWYRAFFCSDDVHFFKDLDFISSLDEDKSPEVSDLG